MNFLTNIKVHLTRGYHHFLREAKAETFPTSIWAIVLSALSVLDVIIFVAFAVTFDITALYAALRLLLLIIVSLSICLIFYGAIDD